MKAVKLSDLKKGECFTLKDIEYPKENQFFIKGEYDRSEKAYICDKFSDISVCKVLKGDKLVFTDFYF